jgi:Ca2+-binding RTX toxin-like protein
LAGGLDGVRVLGGEGNDALAAPLSKSLSLSHGGARNDRLAGAVLEDELYGEDGDDELVACGGGRRYGGRGNNRLRGSGGEDSLEGRACCATARRLDPPCP